MSSLARRSLVATHLAPVWASTLLATILALVLGVVSALVMNLVGPAIAVLSAERTAELSLESLFGPRYAELAAKWFGVVSLRASDVLEWLPAALITLAALKALLSLSQWYLWERAGELASKSVRSDLMRSFLALDPARRREDATRDKEAALSSCVSTDVRMFREYIVRFYGGLPREGCQVIFLAANLVLLDPFLTMVFVIGVLPAVALIGKIGRKLRRRAARALEDYSLLSEWLQQRLLGIETIKHYGTEQIEARKMEDLTENLYVRFFRAAKVKARTSPLLETVAVISLVIVLGLALFRIAEGDSTGAVQMSFFATLAALSQAGSKLGKYFNANREGAAAIGRIDDMLEHLRERQKDQVTPSGKGERGLVCKNVTITYPGTAGPALMDFTHTFAPGKIHCLVGPSGAGKSSLLNAVLGLVEPSSGTIERPGGEQGQSVLYLPQKVQVAPDTVAANVAYPDTTWDETRVWEALKRVALEDVVRNLPQQLETPIGEGGHGLSGGQAQRVLLARLYYHSAPLILVDEGTSALDPEVESLVLQLLRELADRGSCIVMIAHRPAAAAFADEVVHLEKGRKR